MNPNDDQFPEGMRAWGKETEARIGEANDNVRQMRRANMGMIIEAKGDLGSDRGKLMTDANENIREMNTRNSAIMNESMGDLERQSKETGKPVTFSGDALARYKKGEPMQLRTKDRN